MQMPNTTPDFRQLCTDLADDLGFWMEYGHAPANLPHEESCTFQLLKRARAALAAEPQGPAVARLMYWNGKGGNLGVNSPIARTYTEMPEGQAPYWDEGEPLYLGGQGNSGGQP